MTDFIDRDCDNCVFHDGRCLTWNCEFIDRRKIKEKLSALEQEPCTDAVSIRKDILKCRVGNIVAYNVEWLKKHWQMEMDIVCGVKPCDDAISREAAIQKIKEHSYPIRYDHNSIENGMTITGIEQALNELPSVHPICEEREKGECPWYAG